MVDTVRVYIVGDPISKFEPNRWYKLRRSVRIKQLGSNEYTVEAELPKLLWGHNGRLITSQVELEESLKQLRSILEKFLSFSSWQFGRVDLCWQFEANTPVDVILAHQGLRFPTIRKLPSLMLGGREIVWKGAKSRFALKMYSKADASDGGSDVLRVELGLSGNQLGKRLDRTKALCFEELERIFCTEVVKLPTAELPEERRHSFAEIFAGLSPRACEMALRMHRRGRTERAIREFEKSVRIAHMRMIGWNWREILSDGSLPPAVHVLSRRGSVRINHFSPDRICQEAASVPAADVRLESC